MFLFLLRTLTEADFLVWGWRYPFLVAFAINVVALFAWLRLVVTEEYTRLLEEGELEPLSVTEVVRAQGYNRFIGAVLGILGTIASGMLADRIGRRTTLGLLAALIGVYALFTPWLLGEAPRRRTPSS